jgi:hypothetical protein
MNEREHIDLAELAKPTRPARERIREALEWHETECAVFHAAIRAALEGHPRTVGEKLDAGLTMLDLYERGVSGNLSCERWRLMDRLFLQSQELINGGGDD